MKEIIDNFKEKGEKTISLLTGELNSVRAGRANPSLLDQIRVDYYGTPTPLKNIANISVPDPKSLMISPFDHSAIKEIIKAINESELGINPLDDGKNIRLKVPQLTEERRKDITKMVKQITDDAKIAIRNLRRDANDHLKKAEKNGEISEDELKGDTKDIQTKTDEFTKKIDGMLKEKEKTGHKSSSLLFTISLLLMFFIGLYLSNGNPAASLQFSLLYALSFLLLPFFLLLFFSEGRSFSDLFYLFTRGRLALYLLASLSFFSLLLGFPLFSVFLFLLGIPLGIVLDYTALKIEYGQSGKVLKICFLYSIFALSLFLFFGFCFVGFSLLNYILGRLWEGNLNLKGFLEFLLSHFPE